MPAFSDTIIDIVGNVRSHLVTRAAAEQGGIISGDNPTKFNTNDPIRLWVIQVGIIIIFTQFLAIPLAKLRQPRVVAEVIGGCLLGPTAMGRIPHFTAHIFPPESLPYLNLTSTIGLVLFLFLVGLEVDTRVINRNARTSLSVSAAGILLPFGLGTAAAVPIYHKFIDPDKASFGHFLLFTGVAISITAFPVLCRILTETKLLDTTVGVIVLSAGVGNDVVGWILLALTVALVNAGSGLTALYILLATVGGTLVLLFPIKWAFLWLARRTGSIESGQPTPLVVTVTLLLVFSAAFFTDIIGVHAIFGGFLTGLIIPHEGGFAIALVEKLEDVVTIILLPIYFTLSGLKTDFSKVNTGIAWGYTILLIVIAFFGKFVGCAVTARYCGFNIRESGAIGALMSCKGLVELIVLNIGLQAGILDTRVFSMFVIMALVLTIITTPLTLWIYPPEHRTVAGDATYSATKPRTGDDVAVSRRSSDEDRLKTKFTVVLSKIEQLPLLMTLVQHLQPPAAVRNNLALVQTTSSSGQSEAEKDNKEKEKEKSVARPQANLIDDGTPRVSIDALRLIELTDRTSAVMQSSEAGDLLRRDALINVFRTFGHLNRIPVTSALSVVLQDSFSSSVSARARDTDSDLVILPWTSRASQLEDASPTTGGGTSFNPFDSVFGKGGGVDRLSSSHYSHFIRSVFVESMSDIALFIDRGATSLEASAASGQHIILPFFGGPDDRLALRFAVQLCIHPGITATIVRLTKTAPSEGITPTETRDTDDPKGHQLAALAANLTVHSTAGGFPDTVYPAHTTQTRMASQAADDLIWAQYSKSDPSHTPAIESALTRITFTEVASSTPLQHFIRDAATEVTAQQNLGKSVVFITGRARRLAVESHEDEIRKLATTHQLGGSELRKTVGDVTTALIATMPQAILVMQEANIITS